jgi:hypothetical protein
MGLGRLSTSSILDPRNSMVYVASQGPFGARAATAASTRRSTAENVDENTGVDD